MAVNSLVTRVERAIEARFPHAAVHIASGASETRVSGWIAWDGFENVEQVDRQRQLREALDSLDAADRMLVGPILTLTPGEASDDEVAA